MIKDNHKNNEFVVYKSIAQAGEPSIAIFQQKNMCGFRKNKFIIFVIFVIFFCFPSISQAVTEVYFENPVKEIFKGDSFSIDLKISSLEKSINVVDGTIIYDEDKLEIKNIKTEDSIFSLWTKEPTFDNEIGELSFIGGIPNGFSENGGKILSITFLAKKEGNSLISFQDIFSVYANDGKGTQINPWLKPLSLTIIKKQFSIKNVPDYLFVVVLIVLFIIIRLLIKRNKKHEK